VRRAGALKSSGSVPNLSVVPYGAGTSLEANAIGRDRDFVVALDMSKMNHITAVHEGDFQATVEAGVTRQDLNTHLRASGLFFPVDPGAHATLGGMCATSASGTNAVRYGTMRENVVSLCAVMANGDIVRTARRAPKTAAGYNLTNLLVGSEGTLGVICEATLRLHGLPEHTAAAVVAFDSLESACNAVFDVRAMGVPVARVELMDDTIIDACNRYNATEPNYRQLPVKHHLFFEFSGSQASVEQCVEDVRLAVADHTSESFSFAGSRAGIDALWHARHNAYYAARALSAGKDCFTTDVCVPPARLAECISETRGDITATGLDAPIVGHVGDGNFHCCVLFDPDDAAEMDRVCVLFDFCAQVAYGRSDCYAYFASLTGTFSVEQTGGGFCRKAGVARHRDGRNLHRRTRNREGETAVP
jgi:D-lactate dehydrogenase (cytochrome)